MSVLNLGRISIFSVMLILSTVITGFSQEGYEEYTGNVIGFNGPKVRTDFFTLRITGTTSDAESKLNREVLRDQGQDKLLDRIKGSNLGSFSIGSKLSIPINVVRIAEINGKRRIFVVFERSLNFAELRGGFLSLDYPFGVIEMVIDDKTAKGDGTYIALAQIRWNSDPMPMNELEINNFGTYPAKLVNVKGKIMTLAQ